MLLLSILGGSIFADIIKPRNNSTEVNILAAAFDDWEYPSGLSPKYIENEKLYFSGDDKRRVLFYGDSDIEQYAPRIVKIINDYPLNTKSAVFATRGGCPPILNVFEKLHPTCNTSFKKTIEKYALSENIDSVIIGFSDSYLIKNPSNNNPKYKYYFSLSGSKIYFDQGGVHHALKELKRFTLSIDNPNGDLFNPKNLFEGDRISGLKMKDEKSLLQEYDSKQAEVRKTLIKMASKNKILLLSILLSTFVKTVNV